MPSKNSYLNEVLILKSYADVASVAGSRALRQASQGRIAQALVLT
jgi:hypothetical protein